MTVGSRPELGEGARCLVTRTPYVVFYLQDEQGPVIVRILHHARDANALFRG